jgi:hypothetical protein
MDENVEPTVCAVHRESIAYALHTWRTAEETLRHPFLSADRPAYERAVGAVLRELQGTRSVADLVRYYAVERLARRPAVAGIDAEEEPRVLAAVVEGAAFWRRLRELLAAAVT